MGMSLQPFSLEEINTAIQSLEDNGEDKGEVSDGYHTFNELYEHRCRLFIALLNTWSLGRKDPYNAGTIYEDNPVVGVWKSKLHNDGSSYDGWFIAGMETIYGQITYHLPIRLWDEVKVSILPKGRKWDGHTSEDVLERLLKL